MAKRTKTLSEAVSDSRAKTGSKPVAITLDAKQIARWEAVAKRYRTKKDAFMAMLEMAEGRNEISKEALLAELERRLK